MKKEKKLIVKVLEFIAKTVLEIGITILMAFYMIWNLVFHNIFVLLKKLSYKNVNSLYLLFSIILFSILMTFNAIKIKKQLNELNEINNDLIEINEELDIYKKEFEQDKIELKKEIEELKEATKTSTIKSVVKKTISINPDIKPYIEKYSNQYGLDIDLITCMIFKESSGNPNAKSPSGKYVGLAQYSIKTFYSHRKQLGLSEEDLRTDPEASIQVMTSALSRGEFSHWPNTYKNCVQ